MIADKLELGIVLKMIDVNPPLLQVLRVQNGFPRFVIEIIILVGIANEFAQQTGVIESLIAETGFTGPIGSEANQMAQVVNRIELYDAPVRFFKPRTKLSSMLSIHRSLLLRDRAEFRNRVSAL